MWRKRNGEKLIFLELLMFMKKRGRQLALSSNAKNNDHYVLVRRYFAQRRFFIVKLQFSRKSDFADITYPPLLP